MVIMNEYKTDENGRGYVETNFVFNHNNKDIDIKLHSRIIIDNNFQPSFSSNIIGFERIFHNFIDDTKEELENIKTNMPDKFDYYMNAVEQKLINFFYEEEYINVKGIINTIAENEFMEK